MAKVKKGFDQGPCIYKVREVYSPIMEEFRGNRILVAIPNMEGRKPFSGTPCPSFAKTYLLFQSSDYEDYEVQKALERVIKELYARGFALVEDFESYQQRMLVKMLSS